LEQPAPCSPPRYTPYVTKIVKSLKLKKTQIMTNFHPFFLECAKQEVVSSSNNSAITQT